MIAVVGGLGAAVCWAVATLCSSRSSRMLSASLVVAWVMLVGGLAGIVPAVLVAPTEPPDPVAVWVMILAGLCYVGGLLLVYRGLRVGPVGIVAPVVSTEGALAALIAVLFGETLGLPAAATLAVIAFGVVLTSIPSGDVVAAGEVVAAGDPAALAPTAEEGSRPQQPRLAAAYAITAAGVFAVGMFSTAKAVELGMPVLWVSLTARIVGIVVVALPLLARGQLRLTRAAAPLVVIAGLCELIGSAFYAWGAQAGVGIAAVLSGQFATISAVAAFFLFGERLGRMQALGVVLVVAGVAVLTAIIV